MTTRPWPLIFLAVFQILTPFFTLLFNAWALQVSPSAVWIFLRQRPSLEVFETIALMPIAGVAILLMKRWSYAVFFAALIWSILSNLRHWSYATNHLSLALVIAVYLLEMALAVYFLIPSVRTTYFDPDVRWWEAKPRYVLKIPVALMIAGKKLEGTILNLSEGGAFFSLAEKISLSQEVGVQFWILSQLYEIKGKIVHARELGAEGLCYGVQFSHTHESQKRFRALIRALVLLGFQERIPKKPWLSGLSDWLVHLVKTGKGLVPELQFRNRR